MQGDRLVERAIADDVEDRCEGLLLDDSEVVLRLGDAGRDVAASGVLLAAQALPTAHDGAALLANAIEGRHHVVHRARIDQRTHQRVAVQRVADAHLGVGLLQPVGQRVGDRIVDDDAPRAGAPLAGRPDRAEENGGHRQIEVRVRGDDDGVVATQLENGAREPLVDHLSDAVTHPAASRGRDQADSRIGQQRFSHGAPAPDDEAEDGGVDIVLPADALGNARAGDGGQRHLGRRLPESGVATDGGDGAVPGPDGHREVEGRDDAHDAEGVPLLVHAVARPLGLHGQAVELA